MHPPNRRDRRLSKQVVYLFRPLDCDRSCRNRHPTSPEEWCAACTLAEDDLTEWRAHLHELERAAANHAATVPATDEEWWGAVEAGQINQDEGADPQDWGPWADRYRFTTPQAKRSMS